MNYSIQLLRSYSFSFIADGIFVSSLPLLAVLHGSDPSGGALVVGLFNLPWIFSAATGSIIDKYPPIQILRISNIFRSIFSLGMVLLFLFPEYYNIYSLYILAISIGICEVFYENTLPTIPAKIFKKEELKKFNSDSEYLSKLLKMIIGKFLGPIFVGILPVLAPLFNVFLFFLTSFHLKNKNIPIVKKSSEFSETNLKVGEWFVKNPIFIKLTAMSFINNAVFASTLAIVPIYITSFLKYEEYFVGFAMASMGAGYLIGAKLTQSLNSSRLAPVYIFTALGISTSFILITSLTNIFVICFSMLLFGTCMSIRNVSGWTYTQQVMPKNLSGRITSIQRMYGWSGCAIGPIIGSVVMKYSDIRSELVFCGMLTLITLLVSINIARKNSKDFVLEC